MKTVFNSNSLAEVHRTIQDLATLEASSLASSVVTHHSLRLFVSIWLTSRKEVAYVYTNL